MICCNLDSSFTTKPFSMRKTSLISLFLFLSQIYLSAQERQLVKLWETDSTLKVPESVLFDAANKVLYVSNIDGKQPWEKDGQGSVGKVSIDGKIIAVDWVNGLNAPKGMGLYKNLLYVADVDEIAVIDVRKSALTKKITVEGAMALNDITIDKNGVLYVSDSRGKKIFRVEDDKPQLFLENLQGPNGVLVDGEDLFVLDAGGLYKVGKDKSLSMIANGMEGGADGIENIRGKEFIISCWSGIIWFVDEKGNKQKLLDTSEQKINSADIGYDSKNRVVYVPTFWKNSIVAYELK
jgi:sugar lactone lactonase YvrE